MSPLVASSLAVSSEGVLSAGDGDLALNIQPAVTEDNNLIGDDYDASMTFTTAADGIDLAESRSLV